MNDSICMKCENKRICNTGINQPSDRVTVKGCSRFEQKQTHTNADRIRSMTDEELAEFLTQHHFTDKLWAERWLKAEVEG